MDKIPLNRNDKDPICVVKIKSKENLHVHHKTTDEINKKIHENLLGNVEHWIKMATIREYFADEYRMIRSQRVIVAD